MVVGVSEFMSNLRSPSYDHVYDFCIRSKSFGFSTACIFIFVPAEELF